MHRVYLCLSRSSRGYLGVLCCSHCGIDLFTILPSDTRRGSTVATALTRSDTDNMRVDSARHAVGNFDVKLGNNVLWVNAILADISDSSTLHHVPHCVTLDGLVFANAARTVGAAHECDVATALLVAAAISSFLCHVGKCRGVLRTPR